MSFVSELNQRYVSEGHNRIIKGLYLNLYLRVFPAPPYYTCKEIEDCKSLLDLGCGKDSSIRPICRRTYSVGVEVFKHALKESRKQRIHSAYIFGDVRNLGFRQKSFDCVVALDVLEHLRKDESYKLIEHMEAIARRKVIIFVPNGFVFQIDNLNPFQRHKSGWQVAEFRKMGYTVLGMKGIGKLSQQKRSWRFVRNILSDITSRFVRNYPELSLQLLCIKKLNKP